MTFLVSPWSLLLLLALVLTRLSFTRSHHASFVVSKTTPKRRQQQAWLYRTVTDSDGYNFANDTSSSSSSSSSVSTTVADSSSFSSSSSSVAVPSFTNNTNTRSITSHVNQDPFVVGMTQVGWTMSQQESILTCLQEAGLWTITPTPTPSFESTHEIKNNPSYTLLTICQDVSTQGVARMLMDDFGIPPLVAHQIRTVVLQVLTTAVTTKETNIDSDNTTTTTTYNNNNPETEINVSQTDETSPETTNGTKSENILAATENASLTTSQPTISPEQRPLYKSFVVNDVAARRKQRTKKHCKNGATEYGLPRDFQSTFPVLSMEMDRFLSFMTEPSHLSQEDPIRKATATVYLRHARLFLGWYVYEYERVIGDSEDKRRTLSLHSIIKTKEKDSAECIIKFIIWLRTERKISTSYEANLLRGLTKLLKFRFAAESASDPEYGGKTYDDIPIIRELRKLHRTANRQQKVSPRSSQEERKWLSWPEYLSVVELIKQEAERLMHEYVAEESTFETDKHKRTIQQRKVAIAFQRYLVLAIFSFVPDRQRTIRELEIGRSFVKDETSQTWSIRHNPDDYKTGKTYGERPPMHLPPQLTESIDNFLQDWRPSLEPHTDHLFVQPRTGNPLSQDSLYQLVGRACFEHTGKKTNPHLLRDMVVTHVRESSSASEKELAALALFMGHSLHMQRTSYDRRTLTKKVAPAVQLLETINSQKPPNNVNP